MQFAKNVIKSVVGGSGEEGGSNSNKQENNNEPGLIMPDPEGTTLLPPGQFKVTKVTTLEGHEERVWSLDWHPTEQVLASCSGDKTIKLWSPSPSSSNPGQWKCIDTLEEHTRTVRQVAWAPNGLSLAAASFDATVSIWRKTTPQFEMAVESILDGHENEVKAVAWDQPSGKALATCSRDKSVWIWDKPSQQEGEGDDEGDDEAALMEEFECAAVLTGHAQDIKSVKWLPNSRILMSCGYDDTIKVWQESKTRKDDWHCTKTLTHHTGTVWQLAFPTHHSTSAGRDLSTCAEHSLMLSCSDDATVQIWKRSAMPAEEDDSEDSRSWAHWVPVTTVSGVHTRTVYSVDWAPPLPKDSGSSIFISAGGDDKLSVHQVSGKVDPSQATGQQVNVSPLWQDEAAHNADINCVKFCPQIFDGNHFLFASCSDDGKIHIWRADFGAEANDSSSSTTAPAE